MQWVVLWIWVWVTSNVLLQYSPLLWLGYSIKFNDSILVDGVLVLMSSVHLMQIGDGYSVPAISVSLS